MKSAQQSPLNHCVLLDNPKTIKRLGLLSQPLYGQIQESFLTRKTPTDRIARKTPITRTTGVILSPVLGRTFFLPGFGASSLTEDEDDFNEELDVDVEFDVEPELVEDDELDDELELDVDDELDDELELDEEVELGVGGV